MAITASEARKQLFPLIEEVNLDRAPIEITSKRGDRGSQQPSPGTAKREGYRTAAQGSAQKFGQSYSSHGDQGAAAKAINRTVSVSR